MDKNKALLTIAIPTYNRANYLDINLNQLLLNLNQLENAAEIEIIVSDNASIDNTWEVVNKYIEKGIAINYYKNDKNTGFDGNFNQCITKSTGKYFWLFGDDELLFNYSLVKLVKILKSNELGCIYINGEGYDDSFDLLKFDIILDEVINIVSRSQYLEKINYYITFCTGNIINTQHLSPGINTNKYAGTNLIQAHWCIDILNNFDRHLILSEKYFFIKESNTGGYNLFRTFSTNFNKILKGNLERKYIRMINNKLITNFFPFFLGKRENFKSENVMMELLKNYYGYKTFWRIIALPFGRNKIKSLLK